MHQSIIGILLFIHGLAFAFAIGCPERCICQQRTVRCLKLQLDKIPEVPSDTNIIDLRYNHIREIPSNSFNGLAHLHTIFLNENHLTTIHPTAFNGLPSLKYLYLNKNHIANIAPNAFQHMENLQSLYLQFNNISTYDPEIFSNFPRLERLFLYSNKLKHIPEGSFENLPSLKRLRLDNNTLVCDCAMMWFGKMLKNKRSSLVATATCSLPQDIDGRNLIDLISTDYCDQQSLSNSNPVANVNSLITNNEVIAFIKKSPQFIQPPKDANFTEGKAIILHCSVSGTPQPRIEWNFNHHEISDSRMQIHQNGTLTISDANIDDSGIYTCHVSNEHDEISANANIEVFGAPQITVPPDSIDVKIGAKITLECEVDGNPLPDIWWKRNGETLSASNEIMLKDDNMKLVITNAKISDSADYTCVTENEFGEAEAVARVNVIDDTGPPKFLFEPYDLEAIVGTTLELPCKAESDDIIQIKWSKDGRSITPNSTLLWQVRYRISASGSLFITNITEADSGIYECSLINHHGRATASGLITVRKNQESLPGDKYVRIAISEASKEVDQAINQTIATLFSKDASGKKYHEDLFRIVRFPTGPARELARAAEIYERALVNIRKHVDHGENLTVHKTDYSYQDILSPEYLDLLNQLSGCMAHRVQINCTDICFHSKYRTLDGTCNNLKHPMWGASLTGFRRLLSPIYENGFSVPVGWNKDMLYNGFKKPSARLVSTSLISTNHITQDEQITHMVMQWGQFLDHDLDHAIPSVSSESWDGVDCKKTCDFAAPCYPIQIPENDPRVKNRRCIDFVRSSAICGSGMTSVFFGTIQPREQINQLTSFIDASQVYGYSENFARDLRDFDNQGGLLREGVSFPNQKPLLPFQAPTDGIDCRRNLDESSVNCFTAGDIRVNEQVGLLSMHVIWMREHNRIASELKILNPHWDGDHIYYESRKIVGAIVQHITYNSWLPLIVGEDGIRMMETYKGYDSNIDPSISNVFATAAFRFGHSLINPILHRLDENFEPIPQGHLPLHKAFFAPWRVVYEGGVDPLMRGLFTVPAKLKLPDENLNTDLTERLFETAHAVALDLAAINIQRSRDHALPGYNEYRKICGLMYATTFDDFKNEISSDKVRAKLKELYGHPSNVDIWVGGILEDQVKGARVGPLFRCILVEQFKKLRDGDRLWYENEGTFKAEQLAQIKKASLSRILCDNGDNITKITDNVFILPTLQNGNKKCEVIPTVDLNNWVDCSECSRHHIRQSYLIRQRRSVPSRSKRDLSDLSNKTMEVPYSPETALIRQRLPIHEIEDNFIDDDMNEERVEGLEMMIDKFQKSLKQLRKRVRKLEQTCTSAIVNHEKSPHGHCVDNKGIKRLNNEIWMRDDCTKCECEHRQITCEIEKCAQTDCKKDQILKTPNGKCCPECI